MRDRYKEHFSNDELGGMEADHTHHLDTYRTSKDYLRRQEAGRALGYSDARIRVHGIIRKIPLLGKVI